MRDYFVCTCFFCQSKQVLALKKLNWLFVSRILFNFKFGTQDDGKQFNCILIHAVMVSTSVFGACSTWANPEEGTGGSTWKITSGYIGFRRKSGMEPP